jgi:hypothetical protein
MRFPLVFIFALLIFFSRTLLLKFGIGLVGILSADMYALCGCEYMREYIWLYDVCYGPAMNSIAMT